MTSTNFIYENLSKEEIAKMGRYLLSEPIVPECKGCEHVFDYVGPEAEIVVEKCDAYVKPSVKWEQKPVAMVETLVRTRENPRGVKQMLPAKVFRCPMATHFKSEEKISAEIRRAGQQKQKKRR